jgi:glycosyltransferase involved in cell wall biosynthesis
MVDVSVVMATHNGGPFVAHAVESILRQQGANLELVVVEDGSTDGTPAVVRRYAEAHANIRVVAHARARGIVCSYLEGIAASSGTAFTVLDQDDERPGTDALRRQLDVLDRFPAVAVVSGRTNFMDKDSVVYATRGIEEPGPILGRERVRRALVRGERGAFQHGASMVRRRAFEQLGRVLDHDLLIRILDSPWEVAYLHDPVLNYRAHANSTTHSVASRLNALRTRYRLSGELHAHAPLTRCAQNAYWTLLETGKAVYSLFTPRK